MADKITTKVKLKMDMGKVSKFLEDYAEAGMENAMDKAEGIIKDSYQPGSGRIYIKHGKQHRASAPGEPPAVDSGHLRQYTTHLVETKGGKVIGYVGTNVKYGKELELGTPFMKARPYLRPGVFNHKKEIMDAFNDGAKKAGD